MTELNIDLEKEFLFDKTFTCPHCEETVKARTVKTGKAKLEGTDDDLRPKFSGIDSLKYDGILCNHCGYASLRKFFTEQLVAVQHKHVSEKISSVYHPMEEEAEVFTYEEAIRRHKLAYISCMIKNAHPSERGYTCLKTSWLYRGHRESLIASQSADDHVLAELESFEAKCRKSAYEDFKEAYLTEDFPICGMDSATFCYLTAYLAYQEEDYSDCSRWLSLVLADREVSDRVKERARDLKDLVRKATQE